MSDANGNNLRIDGVVRPYSRLRLMIYIAMIMTLVMLAALSGFKLWQYALLLFSLIVAACAMWLTHKPLLHITQPKLTRSVAHEWFITLNTAHGDEIWHGDLLRVQDYHMAIVCQFSITHPSQRLIHRTIYRDQVSAKTWYQLKVLAQLV